MDLQNAPTSIEQQNIKYFKELQQKYNEAFNSVRLQKTQHPDLSTKYEGYMQIAKRKTGNNTNGEYFSSPFLKELRQKRNNMFSDQIIDKMIKQYNLNQYGSFANNIKKEENSRN